MPNFSNAQREILNDLDIDLDNGGLTDHGSEAPPRRRGGILPDLDISIGDDGRMVVDDHKIVDDPEASNPYSAKGRKPPSAPPNDIHAQIEAHVLSASHPQQTLEEYQAYLRQLSERLGVSQMSLHNKAGVWSGALGRGYGRSPSGSACPMKRMGLDAERVTPEEREVMEEFRGERRDSIDDVVEVLQAVHNQLQQDMQVSDLSDPVQKEAFGLLDTMIGTLILQRKRHAAEAAQRKRERTVSDDFERAYRTSDTPGYGQAAPAFASMGLQRRTRPQTDAEAEKLVDQLFNRKRVQPAA